MARWLNMPIPFNSPITSDSAFTHRAGVHTKAVLGMPGAYEALDPASFGLLRHIDTTSRQVGRHALRARAAELGIDPGRKHRPLCHDGHQAAGRRGAAAAGRRRWDYPRLCAGRGEQPPHPGD